MTRLLAGRQVLETGSGLAGAYAGRLLADYGASVTTIVDPADGRRSVTDARRRLYRHLDAAKQIVATAPDGLRPDAVVATIDPTGGEAGDRLAAVVDRWPGARVVAISPYGTTGPWRSRPANDFVLQAASGSIDARLSHDGRPVAAAGELLEWSAGVAAAIGVVAPGPATTIDVALFECAPLTIVRYPYLEESLRGVAIGPERPATASIVATADGWVGFTILTAEQWESFLAMVGRGDLIGRTELYTRVGRLHHEAEMGQLADDVDAWAAEQRSDDVLATAQDFRVPAGPVNDPARLLTNEHFAARGTFEGEGEGLVVRPPVLVDGVRLPGPAGGDGDRNDAGGRRRRGRSSGRPLEGIRVLDVTTFWAGPFASAVLAALGADVIKVESIQRPDPVRYHASAPPTEAAWYETGAMWNAVNVDKRDLTLDLSSAAGRDAFLRLVARSDVVVENYTPRVMANFGLGDDVLRAAKPDLVYLRLTAFGLTGPWANRQGFAQTVENVSGLTWLTGFADGPPRNPQGPPDPLAGFHGALAVAAALADRDRSGGGGGHHVELSMAELAVHLGIEQLLHHAATGETPTRCGNRSPVAAPQGVYAAGDGVSVALSVRSDDEWHRLGAVLGDVGLPDGSSVARRQATHDAIDEVLSAWIGARPAAEAEQALLAAGLPAAVVARAEDLPRHPQLVARRWFEPVDHPVIGTHLLPTWPLVGLVDDGPWHRRPAPLLGQHNEEVLAEVAGLSAAEITALAADGVTGRRPVGAS